MIACAKCGEQNADNASFCTNCGAPLVVAGKDDLGGLRTVMPGTGKVDPNEKAFPDTELEPGAVFAGRYTIVGKIGEGAMGVVYRASEMLAGQERPIALKLIRKEMLGNQAAVDRLIGEGALTQNIRHPAVVAVHNVGEADGQPFVAMELVDGVSMRDWHRRQLAAQAEIPLKTIARIVHSILDGLGAAHALDIVHRDLKPENIIFGGEPGPDSAPLKILDFGIASAPGKLESGTGTGIGTPRYMAPEQITAPATAGPSADLYSLSVIFYELLMDVLPTGHWQPPSTGRPGVPANIDKLIERGLSNKPSLRPQSVDEYRAAMRGGATPAPLFDPGDIKLPEGPSKATIRKVAIGGGAIAGVLALIGIVGAVIGDGGEAGDTGDIDTSFEELSDDDTGSGGFAMLSGTWNDNVGGSYQVAVQPDGSYRASGYMNNGAPAEFVGSLSAGTYQGSGAGIGFTGTTDWDGGDCHIPQTTFDSFGNPIAQGQFHVDHAPGAPCPARFNP